MKIATTTTPVVRQILNNPLVQGVIVCETGKPPTFEGSWVGKPIPLDLWKQIATFFKKYATDEVQVRLYYDPTSDAAVRWHAWAHPQRGIGLTTKEDSSLPETGTPPNVTNTNLLYLGTIHSHCGAAAFQSGTDENNEKTQDGIHITIGNVNDAKMTLHWRAYFHEFKFDLSLNEVVDIQTIPLPEIPAGFNTEPVIAAMRAEAHRQAAAAYFSPAAAEYPAAWDTNVHRGYSGNGGAQTAGWGGMGSAHYQNPGSNGHGYTSSFGAKSKAFQFIQVNDRAKLLHAVCECLTPEADVALCVFLSTLINCTSSWQYTSVPEAAEAVGAMLENAGKAGQQSLENWREATRQGTLNTTPVQQQLLPATTTGAAATTGTPASTATARDEAMASIDCDAINAVDISKDHTEITVPAYLGINARQFVDGSCFAISDLFVPISRLIRAACKENLMTCVANDLHGDFEDFVSVMLMWQIRWNTQPLIRGTLDAIYEVAAIPAPSQGAIVNQHMNRALALEMAGFFPEEHPEIAKLILTSTSLQVSLSHDFYLDDMVRHVKKSWKSVDATGTVITPVDDEHTALTLQG